MTVGSLFSGIGGLDLGLECAGFSVRWQVEKDAWCRRVLAKHWPDVPRYDDIKELSGDELAQVDLICGGFPCPPVSVAGKRQGKNDDRWLWPEFARIIRLVRPRFVLLENVSGLLAHPVELGDVLGDLAASGYDAEWDCLPAAAVGAPHRRDRVFVVAYAKCAQRREDASAGDNSDRSHTGREKATGRTRERRQDVADADGRRCEREREPQSSGFEGPRGYFAHGYGALRQFRDASDWWNIDPADLPDANGERLEGAKSQREQFGISEELVDSRYIPDADGAGCQEPAESVSGASKQPTADAPCRQRSFKSHVGRVADGIPKRVDRLRGLGNAVVPAVAEFIGRRILAVAAQFEP